MHRRCSSRTLVKSRGFSCTLLLAILLYLDKCICIHSFLSCCPLRNARVTSRSRFSCNDWCQWAEVVVVVPRGDSNESVADALTIHEIERNSSLTSPRAWIESMQTKDDVDTAGGGAYSVVRCDYRCGDGEWKIWGLDFHLKRLQDSYYYSQWQHVLQSRQHFHSTTTNNNNNDVVTTSATTSSTAGGPNDILQTATQRSRQILNALLENIATQNLQELRTNVFPSSNYSSLLPPPLWAVTVTVTLLWQAMMRGGHEIPVKGHCTSTGIPVNLWEYHPEAVVASVALKLPHSSNNSSSSNGSPSTTATSALPNRYNHSPEAKLVSWIQRRRPLEHLFQKQHNIGEVLLLRQLEEEEREDQFEILEGLTSNIFFVYPGGKLRTASSGVLTGYARHIVLQAAAAAAANCDGLHVDHASEPITLDDAPLWQEVFMTSSIKLVAPLCQIIVPTNSAADDDDVGSGEIIWKQIWSASHHTETPYWLKIRRNLIRNVHF